MIVLKEDYKGFKAGQKVTQGPKGDAYLIKMGIAENPKKKVKKLITSKNK